MKDNVPAISQCQYDIPTMNIWLITSQLPNINRLYKIRKNDRCNNG